MARITHEVYAVDLTTKINLKDVAMQSRDVILTKRPFHVLRWRHKYIGGTCMVYANGKIIHHGSKKQLRCYLRILQKLGFISDIKPIHIYIVTKSTTANLHKKIDYEKLVKSMNGSYEPELFNGCIFKKYNMTFIVYSTGKVIVTGVSDVDVVNGVLIEILLYQ